MHFLQDIRFGVRLFRRQPGFAALAIVTISLGIGVTSTMFSVVNAVLLRPLPYPEPNRLLLLRALEPAGVSPISWPDFVDWRARGTSFDAMGAERPVSITLMGDEPESLHGRAMTASMFTVLGVRPLIGRVFGEAEDRRGGDAVVVLGYQLWQRRFAGDRDVAGRMVTLNGRPTTVVGVMPAWFRFQGADLWIPLEPTLDESERHSRVLRMGISGVARLRRDRTLEQARSELEAIARGLQDAFPASNTGVTASAVLWTDAVSATARPALLTLFAAVGLVLLIACANVAALLLSRVVGRMPELTLRVALGANRGRIVRQSLSETAPLAAIGAAGGLGLTWMGIRTLPAILPLDFLPPDLRLRIDGIVLVFTAVIGLAMPLLFAVLPALELARVDARTLLPGFRTVTGGRRARRTRSVLVAFEIALALVLMVAAGLLFRTFERMRHVDMKFDAASVLVFQLTLPEHRYPTAASCRAVIDRVVEQIRTLPGVRSAAAATGLPVRPSSAELWVVTDETPYSRIEDLKSARYTLVSPGYFEAMGIEVRGRTFTDRDRRGAPGVAIVNEALVQRFFGGRNAIGRRIILGLPDDLNRPGLLPPGMEHFDWLTIVGVAADARNDGVSRAAQPEAYTPYAQSPDVRQLTTSAFVVLRASGDPARLAAAARAQVHAIDPQQPVQGMQTMESALGSTLQQPRFHMLLLAVFAALAFVLAIVGVYGVVSHNIAQRTKEIGVRLALGATRRAVLRTILGQSLQPIGAGVMTGLFSAAVATRVMRGLLFGVTPGDPLTFVSAAIGLLLVASAAAWVPARRAIRADPVNALRQE